MTSDKIDQYFEHMHSIRYVVGKIAGKRRSVSEVTPILSQPHGAEQELHLDFPENEEAKKDWAIFVGIMDGSKLIIVDNGKKFTITYNKGDIVVMRGDVFHCGASYHSWNVRLHFYLDWKIDDRTITNIIRRQQNTTYKLIKNINYEDIEYSSLTSYDNEFHCHMMSAVNFIRICCKING
jgi:hypothetical protein